MDQVSEVCSDAASQQLGYMESTKSGTVNWPSGLWNGLRTGGVLVSGA